MNNSEPPWDLYRSFLAVFEEGSLSAAARALGLTQPTLTRHIEALEASLGFQLFTRSRQGLAATEAALALKPYADMLASASAAMLREASGLGRAVRGTVRVSASQMVGTEVLPAIFASLRRRHPELEIELTLSNTVDDLLRRDADIAVRMLEPTQKALVVRRMGTVTLGLHAHRQYLGRAGTPHRLKDLDRHSLIGFDRETAPIRSMRRRMPEFADFHFAFRTDSDVAQFMAIRAGFGIGICQVALAKRHRELERVLATSFGPKLEVWLAMHENLRSTPRCRAVFDALAAGLKAHVD